MIEIILTFVFLTLGAAAFFCFIALLIFLLGQLL